MRPDSMTMAIGPSMNMHMIQAKSPHSFWKAVNSIVLLNCEIWYARVYWPLCIFFNMGVFYHPPGDSLTMGLQITIFVSVFVFTSLVPHRKKIQNLFDGACHPRMVHHHSDCEHPSTLVTMWVYIVCPIAGGRCLVKQIKAELPHDIVQTRKHNIGAPRPAMWLLHKVYQGPGTVLTVRYVVSVWLRPTRYSGSRWPCKWLLPTGYRRTPTH